MDITRFRKKLERYLKGTANETERAIVEAWYKSYHPDEERQINAEEKALIRQAINKKITEARKSRATIINLKYLGIAASLLLISGAALFYYRSYKLRKAENAYTLITTTTNQIRQVTLPDSSVMWVNSSSSVRVPERFNDTLRTVLIDEGEAFFEVKHNKSKPFRVSAPALEVQVLGTSFNVNAYKNLKLTRVAVAAGKVAVSAGDKTLSLLTPGQQLTFNNNRKTFTTNPIAISDSYGWKDGHTYLKQATFNELALVMKNRYRISLKAATPEVAKYRFTLRLERSTPLNGALEVISMIHNTHFRKEGETIILY